MSHAPWTKEQAEQWAKAFADDSDSHVEFYGKLNGFLAGLAKAAQAYEAMIEASPAVYAKVENEHKWFTWSDCTNTHQAKLVGVKPIGEESK